MGLLSYRSLSAAWLAGLARLTLMVSEDGEVWCSVPVAEGETKRGFSVKS